jgi:hypothetical protein
MKPSALFGKHGQIKRMHIPKTKTSIKLRLEQISLSLPMNLIVTFLTTPPEITDGFLNLMTYVFRDEKTAHHVGWDGLYNSTNVTKIIYY